jgi:hypothetical protein
MLSPLFDSYTKFRLMLSSHNFWKKSPPFNLTINDNNPSRQHGNGCIGVEIMIGVNEMTSGI